MKKILLTICGFVSLQIAAQSYCVPVFSEGCDGGDLIDSFEIPSAGFSDLSTGCSTDAYDDNTSTQISVIPTVSYAYSITHDYTDQKVRIWVDFNNDGTFDDAAPELVSAVSSSSVGGVPTSIGSIMIPASVAQGTYRMRVATKYSSQPVPCNTSGYGEAHDYTLVVGAAPSCLAPSNLSVTGVSTSGATLNWTAPTSSVGIGYDYYYSTTNTAPNATSTPSGNVGATAVSAPISSLTPGTTYYSWVRAVCTTTDKSMWVPAPVFTTNCIAVNPPYTINFDNVTVPNLPDCTSVINNGSGPNQWQTYENTGGGIVGKVLRYVYDYDNAADTWFFTNGLNLTAGTTYRVRFKYATSSSFSVEKLKVEYGASPNLTGMSNLLVDLPNISNATPETSTTLLTPTTTGVYYFGFNAYSDADMYSLFIDDIEIIVAPTCNEPSALTATAIISNGATIGWTAPSTAPANGYEYYYSTSATAPTAATVASGTSATTTKVVSGLTPATHYYLWVRSVCSSTDKSEWSVPVQFLTSCISVSTITENFDTTATGELPPCWTSIGSEATYARVYSSTAMSGPNALYLYTSGGAVGMVSLPEVNTLQTGNYILKFNGRANFTEGGVVEIGYLATSGDTSTFTSIGSYTTTSVSAIDNFELNITGIPAGVNNLVLKHTGTPGNSVLLDDFQYVLNTNMAVTETMANKNNLKIHPNPFSDVLNISDVQNVKSVSIMDVSGKLVRSFDKPESTLRLADLNAGMYLVVLTMKDGSKQTIKAIKK